MAAAAVEGLDAGVGVGESEVKGKSHSAPDIRRHVHYDDAGVDAGEDGDTTRSSSKCPRHRRGAISSRLERHGRVFRCVENVATWRDEARRSEVMVRGELCYALCFPRRYHRCGER